LDEKYRGYNSKQVFDLLKQEMADDKQSGGKSQAGEGGFDEHDWEGANELPEEDQKELERQVEHALRQGKMQQEKCAVKEQVHSIGH